jgi:hypothetical protein
MLFFLYIRLYSSVWTRDARNSSGREWRWKVLTLERRVKCYEKSARITFRKKRISFLSSAVLFRGNFVREI